MNHLLQVFSNPPTPPRLGCCLSSRFPVSSLFHSFSIAPYSGLSLIIYHSPWAAKSLTTGISTWVFFGRNDAKAETPVLWPPHAKSWLIGKDSDAGRDWGQKGMTEDEMAGWHHGLDGHEFEWTGSWWWTGRPGVPWFMGSERVGHDWATELNWLKLCKWSQSRRLSYSDDWDWNESIFLTRCLLFSAEHSNSLQIPLVFRQGR